MDGWRPEITEYHLNVVIQSEATPEVYVGEN